MTVTIGSACSGYGGLEMGLSLALGGNTRTAWHIEFDKHPAAILEHRYPGVPNYGDVTAVDWSALSPMDVLTAGFPCQDVSHAGLRKGLRAGTRTGGAVRYGNRRDLARLLHRQDLVALTVVLAGMVDPDRTPSELLAWTEPPQDEPDPPGSQAKKHSPHLYKPADGLAPCGTHSAYVRHKKRGEQIDHACQEAERAYMRDRKRRVRAAARAQHQEQP
jgi:hypothetical protein